MTDYKLVPAEIIDRFPEINTSNYGHDDVCVLNEWGVELVLAAAPAVQGEHKPFGYIRQSAADAFYHDDLGVRANIVKTKMFPDCVALYTDPKPEEQPRSDALIVEQTERIAALLAGAFYGSHMASGEAYRDSKNPKALQCWDVACRIQEELTDTDVENAVAELDEESPAEQQPAPDVRGSVVISVDEIPEHSWHGRWHTARGVPVTFSLPASHPMEVLHEDGSRTKGWTGQSWSWEIERGIAEGANIVAWRFYDKSKYDASIRVAPQPAEQHPFEWPKLERPAKVGAVRFDAGVSSRLVVKAAQRQYEYDVTPEKEADRIARLDGFRKAILQSAPDMPGLTEALRQYQRNDGSGLVFGYDKLLVDQYVAGLVEALECALETMENVDGANDCSRGIDAVEEALAAHRKGGE